MQMDITLSDNVQQPLVIERHAVYIYVHIYLCLYLISIGLSK